MKIKRFNETMQNDISNERVAEIVEELKVNVADLNSKLDFFKSLESELNNYQIKSETGNDQIDDSISYLQVVNNNIENTIDKTDNIIKNLVNYIEDGRKYLYTEK